MRNLLVVLVFLDFQTEHGFQGRFSTVESGSRFSGHLIVLHQTPLVRMTLVQFFGPQTGFRVPGRFPAVRPKSLIIGPPETFP